MQWLALMSIEITSLSTCTSKSQLDWRMHSSQCSNAMLRVCLAGKVNGVHQRNEAPMNSEVGPPPPPPPLPAKQTVTSPVYKNDPRQRAASSHAVSNDPRQRSAANLGPEATVQPPQNIQAPAPPPGPPPQVPDKANSQNPEEIELTADIEHVNGRGAENEHSAANLAAQLTQTGMSTQMLLDALAALPNVSAVNFCTWHFML